MREIEYYDQVEYSFWGNVNYESNAVAKKKRDAMARELRIVYGRRSVICSAFRNKEHRSPLGILKIGTIYSVRAYRKKIGTNL